MLGPRRHSPPNLAQAPKFLIGSIVISLSRCCLPNDEGPTPQIFFLEPPLLKAENVKMTLLRHFLPEIFNN